MEDKPRLTALFGGTAFGTASQNRIVFKGRRRNHFRARSVPPIIGANQKRWSNILKSLYFAVSPGIADFWAGANSWPTVEAFSLHFRHLDGGLFRYDHIAILSVRSTGLKKFGPRHGYLFPDDNEGCTIAVVKLRSRYRHERGSGPAWLSERQGPLSLDLAARVCATRSIGGSGARS
jgi:hypothetical protein